MKDLKNYLAKYQTDGMVKTVRQLTKFAGVSKEETIKELDHLYAEKQIAYTLLDRLPGGPFVFLTYADGFDQTKLLMPDVDIHTEDQPWAAQVFNLLANYTDVFSLTQENVDRYNNLIKSYFEYYKSSVLYDPTMVADTSDQTDVNFDGDPVEQASGPEVNPTQIAKGASHYQGPVDVCYICHKETMLDRWLCPDCTEKLSNFVRYPVAWLIDPTLVANSVYVELIRQYQMQQGY